ncbi:MAG: hypothetical protein Unbinned97contig1000_12 [Prokaryotic dsDNA virus sp.]|nr:MAG: hypothetical protein Unbinned97contig1000_12 [Prokaryotic dsDNA virus sp.]|tara:strand:- start:24165 stop:26012 length:1848 start_codon:yes stop_codon:yes gene_type:complete
MSFLNQFGIAIHKDNLEEFAMSIDVTDEIAEHLVEQGIDLSSINKMQIPSGFSKVGSITILCHLPIDFDWRDSDLELWAIVGAVKWKLSKNYRIHRVFAQPISDNENEIRQTLAVLSVDDWRYDLNITGSNNTNDEPKNEYANDFSIVGENVTNEIDGVLPYELANLDWEKLYLFYDLNWTPSLENAFNAWGYEREMSDAELADRVLTACGLVAVPQPILRDEAKQEIGYQNEYLYGGDITGNQQPFPNTYDSEKHYMVAEYIGDGHICATQLWNNLHPFYKSGQLECAYGTPERNDVDWGVEDRMSINLDNFPEQPDVSQNIWIAKAEDGNQEIPATLDVLFPSKTTDGNFLMYRVTNVEHGKPSTALNSYSFTSQYKTLTDHIKTVSLDNNAEGKKLYYLDIDPDNPESTQGLTLSRTNELLERALHLSRCFYARYYACTGNVIFVGWHHTRAIPGCTYLEYGFSKGSPYTKLSGNKNHNLFGFSSSNFSNNSIVTGGGLLINRPDGQSEIIAGGGGFSNSGLLCQVIFVQEDVSGCAATHYDLKRLSDGKKFYGIVPTDRAIPNMCYEPIGVDSLVLFAFVPESTTEEPNCDEGVCNYLFIAGEEVQTVECT